MYCIILFFMHNLAKKILIIFPMILVMRFYEQCSINFYNNIKKIHQTLKILLKIDGVVRHHGQN